jgi:cytoskeletal protein RodZ
MNDPRRPEHTRPARHGGEPTERLRQPYPPYNDPAYAAQSPYGPGLPPRPGPTETNPTEKLPQYWLQDQASDQPTTSPAFGRSKPPRWLWIAAAAAALLVAALVIALVIANGAARKQTTIAPLPAMPGSKTPGSATSPSQTTSAPSSSTSTSGPSESSETTSAAGEETVVYNVTGQGRAISITYVDTGGVMQTEFNVALPWSKQVSLPKSGDRKPNVTIINIGNDVTCTVTVAGVQVREHTGAGLTVCDAPA